MNVKQEKICRLCLKLAEENFEIIDDITRKMFDVLLLKLNLDITKDPIMCKDCAGVAAKCVNFKSVCINSENLKFSFAIDENKALFEMKDVHKYENDIEIDDNFICRFCLNHLSKNNFILVDTLTTNVTIAVMLQVTMPEMHMNTIKNSVMCTSCKQDLELYIKFVQKCLDVEGKIMKYLQNEGTPFFGQVELSEILCSSFKNISESDDTQMLAIKLEGEDTLEDIYEAPSEVHDIGIIKAEETLDIKDEAINFNETDYGKAHKEIQNNIITSETEMGKTYTKYKGELNKKTNQMLISKNVSTARIFKCEMCLYQAKYKVSLKRHMLVHKDITEVEMYKCSTCTYETKHRRYLVRHLLTHKNITQFKMYKCSMCTHETTRISYLKNHMLIHKDSTEVEMYKCSMCTYETKHKDKVKVHMLIHKDITEVEIYKCSLCTYETIRKSNLNSHMIIHKDSTEVEIYRCSVCAYNTKRKSDLKSHVLTHKNSTEVKMYKCSLCTYETRHKSNLKSHMLSHKDIAVKMHKCSVCTFLTKRKGDLKRHMLVHKDITEVEMYKCSICAFETKHKRALKTHMLIHKDIADVELLKWTLYTYRTK